jgi:hypothetical protein
MPKLRAKATGDKGTSELTKRNSNQLLKVVEGDHASFTSHKSVVDVSSMRRFADIQKQT